MLKYTHPRAYLPDLLHGSTVTASMRPGGAVELLKDIGTRRTRLGTSEVVAAPDEAKALMSPNGSSAGLARSSEGADMVAECFLIEETLRPHCGNNWLVSCILCEVARGTLPNGSKISDNFRS